MNKLLTKIVGAALGVAMTVGVGVAVASNANKGIQKAEATGATLSLDSGSGGTGTMTYKSTDYAGVKIGASKSSGKAAFTVASGATSCSLFAAGWSGKTVKLQLSASVGTISPTTVTLTADTGVSGSGNSFTIAGSTDSDFKKEFTLSNVTSSSKITITTASDSGDYRAAIWNANYETGSVTPTVTIDDTATEINVDVLEGSSIEKTLQLTNVTMAELTIASSNAKATVSTDADNKKITITGVEHGTADVTIKKSSTTLFTVHVTVNYDNTVTVTSAGGATSLNQGATLQLSASSSKGADTFTWSSSDDDVATVSSSGLVTGVGAGSVTITAASVSYEGTSGTKELTVNFGGSYSRANWYNVDALNQDNPSSTSASGTYVKESFSGYSSTIASASTSGTVAYDKAGGLSLGKSSAGLAYIEVTMKSSAFYLKSVTIWGASWDAGVLPVITATNGSDASDTVTQMSNGGEFVSHGVAKNDSPLTWTFNEPAKTVRVANNGAGKNRFTIYQMDLVFENINAETVTLSDSNATLMQTETKQLTAFASPKNYNIPLGTTWTSSNSDVASVSNSGLITASSSNTGNVTITASYTLGGNPATSTCSVKVIKLAASSVNIRGDIANSLTGGASESLTIAGKTWSFSKTLKYVLDYKSGSDINAYTKNGLRIGESSTPGSITNDSQYAFKFKKVIVAHCLNAAGTGPYAASFEITGSNDKGGSDVESTSISNGMLTVYTLNSAVNYVNVATTGGTYVSSLTFVFETPEETALSASEFILGLSPDRGEESIGSCSLANGTYKAAKKFLYDAGDDVKDEFQTSSESTVVAARERYTIWAANNHDSAPYSGEEPVVASARANIELLKTANAAAIIAIVSVISLSAVAGFFLLRKRKEQ